jgi:beta-1,4-mannosyltransferase
MNLRVASWPGKSFALNDMIPLVCEGLAEAGVEVIDLKHPRLEHPRCDILHIHWPEQVFWAGGSRLRTAARAAATLLALRRLSANGTRIVWTVHNLSPHDLQNAQKLLWSFYQPELVRMVDGFMTLSPSTLDTVRERIPNLAGKMSDYAWHPAYPDTVRGPAVRARVREDLGIPQNADVVGFLGQVRPYKGVDDLIRVFRETPDPNLFLLIAGKPSAEYGREIAAMAAGDDRIKLRLKFLDSGEFCDFTAATDLIVAPYRDYLHSGTLIHAASSARPVLTPTTPFSSDLADEIGGGWVINYEPPLTPEVLISGITARKHRDLPDLSRLSMQQAGRRMVDFYQRVMSDPIHA